MKLIAYYLPQFHPIPENNHWWGEGFTEWTNVKEAKPLFPGHEQPVAPGELGYYNLLDPDIRNKQAELAKEYGVHGFCYWHYWFGNGRTLLEKPFQEVLKTGEPDLPFCLGWANESWTGIWHGSPDKILMKQIYPGEKDIRNHFDYLLPAFKDSRYILIENRPFFLVYKPLLNPHLKLFTSLFSDLAIKHGFDGIHFVATNVPETWNLDKYGFQALAPSYHNGIVWKRRKSFFKKIKGLLSGVKKTTLNYPKHVYRYNDARNFFLPVNFKKDKVYPTVVPNWDNSPRSGKRAVILTNSTPELYGDHLRDALLMALTNSKNHQILMVKSWNEWAEGNYLEPDKKWKRAYLEKTREMLSTYKG